MKRKIDLYKVARAILMHPDWKEKGYDLKELFEIRDALSILDSYGLGDKDLRKEVDKYIRQKGEGR